MNNLKVVYAGTPEFAQIALQAIIAAGYEVPLVLTQPDRPAGRGMKLQPSAVKKTALEHQIQVLQPTGLKLDGRYANEALAAKTVLEKVQPDVIVVAAYGLILPQWVLDLPRLGCLNIHASLLPRWRGAAPIHRAIEAGDAQTGVCIMQMDAGLDTGDVLLQSALAIAPNDTTATLHDKLATLGGNMIVQALAQAQHGQLKPQVQPEEGVNYAHKIDKAESHVNWQNTAIEIERRIRAFDPFPGVTALYGDVLLKLWKAQVIPLEEDFAAQPGELIAVDDDSITVKTGCGGLRLTEVQRPGGRRQTVRECLQAMPFKKGDMLL